MTQTTIKKTMLKIAMNARLYVIQTNMNAISLCICAYVYQYANFMHDAGVSKFWLKLVSVITYCVAKTIFVYIMYQRK